MQKRKFFLPIVWEFLCILMAKSNFRFHNNIHGGPIMKVKKTLAVACAMAMLLALSGCTSGGSSSSSRSSTSSSASSKTSSSSSAASSSMSEGSSVLSDLESRIESGLESMEESVSPTMSTDFRRNRCFKRRSAGLGPRRTGRQWKPLSGGRRLSGKVWKIWCLFYCAIFRKDLSYFWRRIWKRLHSWYFRHPKR